MGFKEDSKTIIDDMLENLSYWNEHVDEFDERENRRLSNFKPYTEVFPTPKLNDDGTVKRDANVKNVEPAKFHLAGKHDQSTHGHGGRGKDKTGGVRPSNDEGFLSIASADGVVTRASAPAGMSDEDVLNNRAAYLGNQKQAIKHLTGEQDWADADKIRDNGIDLQTKDAKEMGYSVQYTFGQKASNAEKLADRMDEKLADVSTSELKDLRDRYEGPEGLFLTQGEHFSQAAEGKHPYTDEEIPPGKRWVFKPRPNNNGVDPVLVDEREAYLNDLSSGLMSAHAKTADNGFPPSTAVQDAVKTRIIDKHPEWGEPSDFALEASSRTRDDVKKFRDIGNGVSGKVVDAYVDSVYEETQSRLKAEGIDELTLHRGTGQFQGEDKHGKLTYRTNPVASYSRSSDIAGYFGGGYREVITSTIPRERIFSSAATGPGCLREEEFIALGGVHEGYAQ